MVIFTEGQLRGFPSPEGFWGQTFHPEPLHTKQLKW